MNKRSINQSIKFAAPEEIWEYLTESQYVEKWNHASDDWKTTCVVNDFKVDRTF